jgi:hypothetical protein
MGLFRRHVKSHFTDEYTFWRHLFSYQGAHLDEIGREKTSNTRNSRQAGLKIIVEDKAGL